ncbi:uncharacterized protein B0I36DRAFT_130121 [Microdochium trichocladiopsis]|uniref:Mid2 domain-containing protein n=1 Tax=Microdochium trichocladiopsis TaxID=1682393 RepID=A0A9P8Y6G7_9PEZI|nr:uncharacterized protein B0I36DRAFT_130121 [Microdochium trichocladiopsis]KAH7029278.1 hypothetical protein B0I36DRAFT_130121 [Microdochium trichocladiopsis]
MVAMVSSGAGSVQFQGRQILESPPPPSPRAVSDNTTVAATTSSPPISSSPSPTFPGPIPQSPPSTQETQRSSSSSGPPIQFAIGIGVGVGLLVLIASSIALFYHLRARKRARQAVRHPGIFKHAGAHADDASDAEHLGADFPPSSRHGRQQQQKQDRRLRALALVSKVTRKDNNNNTTTSNSNSSSNIRASPSMTWPRAMQGQTETKKKPRYYGSGDYEHWSPRQLDRHQQIYHAVSRLGGGGGDATTGVVAGAKPGIGGRDRSGWERLDGEP